MGPRGRSPLPSDEEPSLAFGRDAFDHLVREPAGSYNPVPGRNEEPEERSPESSRVLGPHAGVAFRSSPHGPSNGSSPAPPETAPPLRVRYVDSHTEGEPTRVVIAGAPNLGGGSVTEQRDRFRAEHDLFRRLVVDPPRGSPELVGALLVPPYGPSTFGAIFFNNVGTLGMCGHGSIGVGVTLAHLGLVPVPSRFHLLTPVGRVEIELHSWNEVSVTNVVSHRHLADVEIDVPGEGRVRGDVAWGGNWFFLAEPGLEPPRPEDIPTLLQRAGAIRVALTRQGITGANGATIDHVELSGPPVREDADSRNFVLCPGGEYDRSPCGTGTSARMACLFADHRLKEGDVWRQEGILGTRFVGTARLHDGKLTPAIRGRGFVTAEGELVLDPADPLAPRP